MSALTIRLLDDKYPRLNKLASWRQTRINRLNDEMHTRMLVEFDAETRFQRCARARLGTRGAGTGTAGEPN